MNKKRNKHQYISAMLPESGINVNSTKKKEELISGCVTDEQFWLLIAISSIHSGKVIQSLRDHLVNGTPRKILYERYSINAGYFSVSLSRLSRLNRLIYLISKFY